MRATATLTTLAGERLPPGTDILLSPHVIPRFFDDRSDPGRWGHPSLIPNPHVSARRATFDKFTSTCSLNLPGERLELICQIASIKS